MLLTLGKDYYLINSGTLGATHLMLIGHNSIREIISDAFVDTVATGIFNLIPNKGGIGISFKLGNKRMLVIGCHLASGEDSVSDRVEDFLSIEERLELGDRSKKYASDRFDCTIYFGDMNFRINGKKDNVKALIDLNERFALLKQDELRCQIISGNLPLRYKEGEIGFPPTYKLKGQNYVNNRIPSWTDRILYKDKTGSLIQETYGSIISNIYSDHKPVYSQFTIIL